MLTMMSGCIFGYHAHSQPQCQSGQPWLQMARAYLCPFYRTGIETALYQWVIVFDVHKYILSLRYLAVEGLGLAVCVLSCGIGLSIAIRDI